MIAIELKTGDIVRWNANRTRPYIVRDIGECYAEIRMASGGAPRWVTVESISPWPVDLEDLD